MATKAIELVVSEQYPILFGESGSLSDALSENFGPEGVQPGDLDRIGVPAGGGTAWEIPTLSGTEPSKTLDGIILSWTAPRAFWQQSIESGGGGNSPDCASVDGQIGVGMFGFDSEDNAAGTCDTCPMNQWGSDPGGGRGKACRESRQLLVLRPGDVVPVVLSLSVTSIQPMRKYFLRLASVGKPFYSVVTRFELESKSDNGIKWSVAVPSVLVELELQQVDAVREFAKSVKGA